MNFSQPNCIFELSALTTYQNLLYAFAALGSSGQYSKRMMCEWRHTCALWLNGINTQICHSSAALVVNAHTVMRTRCRTAQNLPL